jgi:uncharacterized Zn finger protein
VGRGTIWWKEKWIDTFAAIGRQGQRKGDQTSGGTVSDLKIENRTIWAQVRGRGQTIHEVQIILPHFSGEQPREVADAVRRVPAIRAALARKQLPIQLFEELQRLGIFLFPSSWADLERIDCTCGDHALPCKHISAVLGQVGAAIGRDPFLIFRLHGCDLSAIARDIIGEEDGMNDRKIPQLEKLFRQKDSEESSPGREPSFCYEPLEQIPFGPLPDLAQAVQFLLTPNPPFCGQNFQTILMEALALWKRRIRTTSLRRAADSKREHLALFGEVLGSHADLPDDWDDEELDSEFRRRWKHFLRLRSLSVLLNSRKEVVGLVEGEEPMATCDDAEDLVTFLEEVPEEALCDLCEELRFLSSLMRFTNDLVGRTAIVPQLLKNSRDELFVRWIPALFNGQVRSDFSRFVSLCPKRLFLFQGRPLPETEQVLSAVDVFFQQFKNSCRLSVLHLLRNGRDEELEEIFFQGRPLDPIHRLKEEEIRDWLAPLHAFDDGYRAHLTIAERDGGNFALSVALSSPKDIQPIPLEEIFMRTENRDFILSALAPIMGQISEMEPIRDRPREVIVSLKRFGEIFFQALPRLRSMGVEVVLPKSLAVLHKPKLRLAIEMKDAKEERRILRGSASSLRFEWLVSVDGHRLNAEEFRKLSDGVGAIVPFAGKYLAGDEVLLLRNQLEKLPKRLGQGVLFQVALAGDIEDVPVDLGDRLRSFLNQMRHCDPVRPPDNLHGTLRPYQLRGFGWLLQNIRLGFGSILADDMGLGKTLQVIALILHLKNEGAVGPDSPVLVVAPTGLLSNWRKEFEKFAPSLRTIVHHGHLRGALPMYYDVVITSYGCVGSDRTSLGERDWFLTAIDEAQNIKNVATQRTRAVKALRAEHRIALSGTPVENRLQEYWSIFDFANCGYLGSAKQFEEKFARPIERGGHRERLQLFRKITGPFILRRLKSDRAIQVDLPQKMESNVYCSLTAEQTALYNRTVRESMGKIEGSTTICRKGQIFALISALKQICNHPAQFHGSSRLEISQSGKMQLLEEILEEIWESGDGKSLIFTQYVQMGQIIGRLMGKKFRMDIPFLHGGLRPKGRDTIIERFQGDSAEKILIISLRAGSTGLNLTAANNVIHYDLWWNPAVEAQATDRAHRIGQSRTVAVRRLITEGTLEERIDKMIGNKRNLANLAVGAGESWITEMSNEDIWQLVSLSRGNG